MEKGERAVDLAVHGGEHESARRARSQRCSAGDARRWWLGPSRSGGYAEAFWGWARSFVKDGEDMPRLLVAWIWAVLQKILFFFRSVPNS